MKCFILHNLLWGAVCTLVLASCSSNPSVEEKILQEPPIAKETFDSIIKKGEYIPERKNARATLNNEEWVSTAYTVNVFTVKDKKIYSIYLTNGNSQVTMNYSGPEKPGTVNTGDFLQAAVRENDMSTYPCNNGFIEFTKFDLTEKKMSGRFKLYCVSEKGNKQKNFDEAVFTDLSWQEKVAPSK